MRAVKTENLIKYLNVKIQGWVNYYRHCVAKATFNYIDNSIFWIVWKWAKGDIRTEEHPGSGKGTTLPIGLRKWCFFSKVKREPRIPHSSHSGTTHEDRKTREGQGGSFAVRSDFREYFLNGKGKR